jgi:uncharacterized oxidoreductase
VNLPGTTVLVTGATRGIGKELTRRLVGLGARVVAAGRDRVALDELLAEYPDRIVPWPVDLADPHAVDALVRDLPHQHSTLSVVVNNAATQTLTDFLTGDPAAFHPVLRREVAVNLDAVIALSTGLLPHLRAQPAAAIVNITTGLALAPKRSAPVYCATKAAVRTFGRALRYQCQQAAPHVHVIDAVMPLVDTDMTRGRGRGKITPAAAAHAVITAIRRDADETYIGKAKLLRTIMRLSPTLGYRMLRDG